MTDYYVNTTTGLDSKRRTETLPFKTIDLESADTQIGLPSRAGVYLAGSYDTATNDTAHHIAASLPLNGQSTTADTDVYYDGAHDNISNSGIYDIAPTDATSDQGSRTSTSGQFYNNFVHDVAWIEMCLAHHATNIDVTNNAEGHSGFQRSNDYISFPTNISYDNVNGITEPGNTGTNNTYSDNAAPKNTSNRSLLQSAVTDYYVNATTGSDSNPGTKAAPFKTIGRASSLATAGTTVHVAPGTYSEEIYTSASGTAAAPIHFVSDVKGAAIIVPPAQGTNGIAWWVAGDYVSVDGFQVQGSATQGGTPWTIGIYLAGSYDTATNDTVHHIATNLPLNSQGAAGIDTDAYYGGAHDDVTNNIVYDIGPAGATTDQGIYISTSGNVFNNLVYDAAWIGICLWHNATNVNIANNTIFGNEMGILVGSGDWYNGFQGPDDYTNVFNNIVYDNVYGISEEGNTGIHNTYVNNLVYLNPGYDYSLQNGNTYYGNIAADPQFVNYIRTGGGDYHLRATSPAIGAGVASDSGVSAPAFDMDGNPRPSGTGYDIGAYQFENEGPIDFTGVPFGLSDSLALLNSILTVSGGGLKESTVWTGYLSGAAFVLTNDGTGGTIVAAMPSATGVIVPSGEVLAIVSGDTDSSVTVQSGGALYVGAGGTANGTTISGGVEYNCGSASGTTVGSGGFEVVQSGGSASGTTVQAGGEQIVNSGGQADGATLQTDGIEYVLAGSTASGTAISAGGKEYVYGTAGGATVGSAGFEVVQSGGTASGTTVQAGGRQYVNSGGTASGTTVQAGGQQNVNSGAYADGATLQSGGKQYVYAGGTASGTTVSGGGTEYLYGTASGVTVGSGAFEVVQSGGTASGTTVQAGGRQYVNSGGTASGTTVQAGGQQNVNSGAHADGATLQSGGKQYVYAGGIASGTAVSGGGSEYIESRGVGSGITISGGFVEITSGGSVGGAITFAGGGDLQLDASTAFAGSIDGFAVSDILDLRDISYTTGATSASFTEAISSTGSTLTVTDGKHTAQLTFLGSYVTGQFHLAGDGHGGTQVTDPLNAGASASPAFTFDDVSPTPSAAALSSAPSFAGPVVTGGGGSLALAVDLAAPPFTDGASHNQYGSPLLSSG